MLSSSSKGQGPPGSAVSPSLSTAASGRRSQRRKRSKTATAPEATPPRFHLLIGAAASGKSTAARILARHLQRPDQPPVRIISSAAIRQELYGDPGILGCWAEVEAEIHRQLCLALAGGETVILDACYVKRSFRLAITQALVLPMAVQWVGWWLDTPLAQCLHWNLSRAHPVPELVIHKHCAHLLQAGPTPHRQEAFALVVRLQTGQGVPLETLIPRHLADLEPCIRRAANRDAAHQLHGYSRLLDQERLLYLIHLLSRYPKLTATTAPEPEATKGGSATRKRQRRGAQRLDSSNPTGDAADGAMEDLLAPLPPGGLAERAAALLGRLHGACYGDPAAVALDLDWLERQGFLARLGPAVAAAPRPWQPVQPPPWPAGSPRPPGGLSRLADREAFGRVFTLLRHLLHHPFDTASGAGASAGAGVGVCEHLARSLNDLHQKATPPLPGCWTWRQVHGDLTDTLTPYGFRLAGSSGRHGYALGTALLSLEQLVAAEGLLRLQARHLGDHQAAALSHTLAQRLQWIGVELDAHPPLRRWLPARPAAAAASLPAAGVVEAAIGNRQRLLIRRRRKGLERSAPMAVWPLQLVFQEGGWWLLIEHDAIGQRAALLEALPLDELHVFCLEQRLGRPLAAHRDALARWEVLIRHGGSLQAGGELNAQLALCQSADPLTVAADWERLRFCCSPAVMLAIRRELDRYPPQAIRLSQPLPGDSWGRPEPRAVLPPAADPRHPYRVEVALPPWVLDGDPALRRWLFSYGGALRLEDPQGLVEEQSQWLKDALAALGPSPAESSLEAPDRCGLVRVGGREWGWPWSPQAAPNKRQRACPSLSALRWTLGANGAIGVAERGAGGGLGAAMTSHPTGRPRFATLTPNGSLFHDSIVMDRIFYMHHFGTETRIDSWDELVRELHSREIVQIREDEGGHLRSPYVFRGTGNYTWPLETSLVRLPGFSEPNSKTIERSLIRSFRKYAKAGSFDDKSEWYVMAVAQHNGLPTRCLDWAASPLVAVHFACSNESLKGQDGVVWCLHAGVLRSINSERHPSTQPLDRVAWVYDTRLLETQFHDLEALDRTFDAQRPDSRLMLLWEPPSLDERIANQFGMLTIMNSATGSQHAFLSDYSRLHPTLVHRVVIAAAAKPEIRSMLDQNNISERTLFPGLPGLCAWLKRYYGQAW